MAAPAPGATTTVAGANGTSVTVTKPSGAVTGDLVVICIYKENTAAISVGSTGFTVKTAYQVTTGGTQLVTILWKRMGASEPTSWAFTWSGSTWRQAAAIRITGGKTAGDPFDLFASAVSNTTTPSFTTPAPTSFTPTVSECLLLAVGTNWEGATWTPPAGYTERVDTQTISFATLAQTDAADIGSVTFTANTGAASRTGAVFALAPLTVGVDYPVSITDGTGNTDSVGPIDYAARVDENVGLVDSLIVPSTPVVAEDTHLTDAINAALAAVRALTETTGATDSGVAQGWAAQGTDRAGLTDSVSFLNEPPTIAPTDLEGLSDTGTSYGQAATGTEFVGLSDTLAIDRRISITDTTGNVDSTGQDAVNLQTVNDRVGITDTGQTKGLGAIGVDPVGLTDSVTPVKTTSLAATINDGAGTTDSIVYSGLIPYSITDSTGITDATQKFDIEDIQTDVAGVSEGVFPASNAKFSVFDTLGLTELLDATGSRFVTLNENVGLVDTASGLGVQSSTVNDTTGLTDNVVVDQSIAKSATVNDSLGLTDTNTPVNITTNASTLNDAENLTDAIVKAMSIAYMDIDDLGPTDTNTAYGITAAGSDTIAVYDNQTFFFGYNPTPTDSSGLTDNVSYLVTVVSVTTLNDTTGITDSVNSSLTTGKAATIDDSMGMTDSYVLRYDVGIPDTAIMSDVIEMAITRVLSDTLGVTDATSPALSSGNQVFVTDNAGLSDIGRVVLFDYTGPADDVGLSDVLVFRLGFTVTDTTGIVDYLDSFLSQINSRTVTDNTSLTDAVASAIDYVRSISDTVTLDDQAAVQGIPVIVDRLGLTDSIVAVMAIPRTINDSVGSVDRVRFKGMLPTTFYYTYGAIDLTVTTVSDQLKITTRGGPSVTIVQ